MVCWACFVDTMQTRRGYCSLYGLAWNHTEYPNRLWAMLFSVTNRYFFLPSEANHPLPKPDSLRVFSLMWPHWHKQMRKSRCNKFATLETHVRICRGDTCCDTCFETDRILPVQMGLVAFATIDDVGI